MTVFGEFDSGAEAAHVTFTLPMLFGMSGEVIVIGQDLYLLTAMTGDDWLHLAEEPATDGESEETPPTDEEIAAKIDELLATEGVSLTKLADQPCGDDTCYHLQLSISAEAMAWMNCELSIASRSILSVITKRVEMIPRPMATLAITTRLTSENQRNRLNGGGGESPVLPIAYLSRITDRALMETFLCVA